MKLRDYHIIKQSQAREVVQRAMRNQRTAHAYLLHGPEGTGKEALALFLAQNFLCGRRHAQAPGADLFGEVRPPDSACGECSSCKRIAELSHPDLHVVFPRAASATEQERTEVLRSFAAQPFQRSRPWENASILIDDVRALKRALSVSSYEGHGSVVLLLEANRLKAESANALLKILEEPPAERYFILTSTSLASLLPTIVSRCQAVAVAPLSRVEIADFLQQHHQVESGRATFLATVANGNLRYAHALLEEDLEARRKLAVEYLRMAFKFNKPLEQMEFLQRLVHENDRHELQQLLRFCMLWIRDAYVLKSCGAEPEFEQFVVNTDFREALLELIKNLPQFDFERVLEEIDYAIMCLERYVQPTLVLMVLLHRIRRLARSGR